jgi:dimeric dUTPase (all-alpha-NTP-PPase superfamily)
MKTFDFEVLLREQLVLNHAMGDPMDQAGTLDGGVKENMLALIVEATEVLSEVNWKPWKQAEHQLKPVDSEALLTELIDVLQFWANAVNSAGFTHNDVARAYLEKLTVCHNRARTGHAGKGS